MVETPVKTAQATVEPSPRSSLDAKELLLGGGWPVVHTATPTHPPGATNLEGSSQYHKKNWKRRTRNLVSKPSIRVFFTLLVVAAISFSPALLSNPVPLSGPTFNLNDGSFNESEPNSPGVKMQGEIFQYDWLKPQTVTVRWFLGVSADSDATVDLYFNDKSKPAFSHGYSLNSFSPNSFEMTHNVEPGPPAYYAPNDLYAFTGFVFAINKTTNESIPITSVTIFDEGPGDFSTESDAATSHYNITYNAENGPTTVAHLTALTIAIKRSVRARALKYSMFAINWTLTVASMITTSIIFSHQDKVPDGIIILPITTILTIPAVRNLFVGSPPFGIFLDAVGFFPQMLIVVACTVVLLSGIARGFARDNGAARNKGALGA